MKIHILFLGLLLQGGAMASEVDAEFCSFRQEFFDKLNDELFLLQQLEDKAWAELRLTVEGDRPGVQGLSSANTLLQLLHAIEGHHAEKTHVWHDFVEGECAKAGLLDVR